MPSSSLYQSFVPTGAPARALVWRYSPEYCRPRHFHDEPELNLIVEGSATFGVGRAVVRAEQGQLLGFPAGQDHVLLEASSNLRLYAIGMDSRFSSEVLGAARYGVTAPLHISIGAANLKALVARSSAVVDRHFVDQQVAEIWEQANWLRQKHAGGPGGNLHVLTRRALSVLSDAPDRDREFLARQIRASPTEISRYFHRDVGMTLARYRTRLRLLRFIRLVDDRAGDLTASAMDAGFGSYSQCHRVFQVELGCAPRAFFGSGIRQRMQLAYIPTSTPTPMR
jgi:AraC-like DNA-binding protein